MTVTTPATLRQLVTRSDDHPALVVPESGASLSYAALQRALDRAAGRLAALGVREGDRVALVAANGPALVVAFLAVVARGAAAAPLNPALGVAEMTAELDDLRVIAAAARRRGRGRDGGGRGRAWPPARSAWRTVCCRSTARPASRVDGRRRPRTRWRCCCTPAAPPASRRPCRSGSATSSRRPARSPGPTGCTGDDVTMCVMPLFHVHGLVATVLATLSTGGTVRAAAVPAVHVLGRRRPVTARPGTRRSRPSTRGCSRGPANCPRRQGTSSGSSAPARRRCPRSLWRRYEDAIGVPLVEAYGMTEAAHQMASNPLPPGERRPGTVGRATGVEIAVARRRLAAGASRARTARWRCAARPSSTEYLDNPAATAAAFRDGWFRTGDVGKLSADGYLTLVGRVKELINRAGEKISPYEVEEVLLSPSRGRRGGGVPGARREVRRAGGRRRRAPAARPRRGS